MNLELRLSNTSVTETTTTNPADCTMVVSDDESTTTTTTTTSQEYQQQQPLAASSTSVPPPPPPPVPEAQYDPQRVCTPAQLEGLNLIVHPVWIFDFIERRMRWANTAGLELWNADTLEELQKRDFKDISKASAKRMEDFHTKIALGLNITEQWTMYPKGQAKTVHMNVSGIRLSPQDDHQSLMCEGIPVVSEELVTQNIRCVEMVRHLPMAVAQFDMSGQVMFQNPAATLSGGSSSKRSNSSSSSSNNNNNNRRNSTNMNSSNTNNNTNEEQKQQHEMLDDSQDDETSVTTMDDDRSTTSSSSSSGSATYFVKQQKQKAAGAFLNRFVDPQVGQQLLSKIGHSKKCDEEAMIHTPDGPKWHSILLRKVNDPVTGQDIILYSATDKTDAIQAQKERKAREQKSEFLAIMAHEIRTPLHQVTGFIDLLDQTQLNSEQKSFVKLLKSSAQGLMTVISDVLDYSKLEAGKMKLECIPYEPFSVVEGSMGAVRASCEEKNITLSLEWNRGIPFRLMGDPNRLRQILLNLLSNAVKFTSHGEIRVQAMPVVDKQINDASSSTTTSAAKTTPNNSSNKKTSNNKQSTKKKLQPMVKYVVTDTGIGISEENKDIIFRKYQQADVSVARNFGGTGLGLSICHLLTQNMGGSIGVDSQVGKGASFWFCLPAEIPAETETTESNEQDDTQDLGSLHVLVVEDNRVNQKLMANMLRRMGHKPELAENGKEAIDMIQQKDYDLILMDIQMPVMDGLEATRRLRTMGYNNLPIYGLTANVARSDYTELGFNDWLAKPIPMKDLKAKLCHFKQCQLLMQKTQ